MKLVCAAVAPLLILAAAGPAMAEDAAGHWLVSARVGDNAFTLDCRFQQAGQSLSGVCVDGDTHDARVKGGRAHKLTKGRVAGDQVAWTYKSSYGLLQFGVDYAGVLKGDHMSGQVSAVGKTGPFTALRSGS